MFSQKPFNGLDGRCLCFSCDLFDKNLIQINSSERGAARSLLLNLWGRYVNAFHYILLNDHCLSGFGRPSQCYRHIGHSNVACCDFRYIYLEDKDQAIPDTGKWIAKIIINIRKCVWEKAVASLNLVYGRWAGIPNTQTKVTLIIELFEDFIWISAKEKCREQWMGHDSSRDENVSSEFDARSPLWVMETGECDRETSSWIMRPFTDAGGTYNLCSEREHVHFWLSFSVDDSDYYVRKESVILIANSQPKSSDCALLCFAIRRTCSRQTSAAKWFLRDWIAVARLDARRPQETRRKTKQKSHGTDLVVLGQNEQRKNKHCNRKHLTQRRQ